MDRELDEWARDAAARAIMVIANKSMDSDLRKKAVACLRQAISNERDLHTRSLLLLEFTEMKDIDSLPFIKSLFDNQMIHPMVTTFAEVKDIYSGSYDDLLHIYRDTKDPMDYFRPRKYVEKLPLLAQDEAESAQDLKPITQDNAAKRRTRIGRNDPCPCGSGKKYKKCCLKIGT
ncbi:MAG: SEC-C metal-binding domain-containing protein [Nitrososphaerales archaeon]